MAVSVIPTLDLERAIAEQGYDVIVGFDEVGRGSLAGPVMVGAAAIWARDLGGFSGVRGGESAGRGESGESGDLDGAEAEAAGGASGAGVAPLEVPKGVADSKMLTERKREAIFDELEQWCAAWAVGAASNTEIDEWGISYALGVAALRALAEVERVDLSGLDRRLGDVHVIAACDVTNPLTGPEGASAVFGPQKGASREDVTLLDGALRHVSSVIERALAEQVPAERNGDGGKVEAAVAESSSPGHRSRPDHRTRTPIADHPGAGAAGGIGMALLAVLHADFRPGIDLVIEQSGLDAAAQWADIVFTGEGSIDAQTMFGKTPVGVASVAKRHGKPVIAVAGHVGDGIECLHGRGIDAVFGAAPGAASLDELLRDARANVARTAEQVTRLMRIVRSH